MCIPRDIFACFDYAVIFRNFWSANLFQWNRSRLFCVIRTSLIIWKYRFIVLHNMMNEVTRFVERFLIIIALVPGIYIATLFPVNIIVIDFRLIKKFNFAISSLSAERSGTKSFWKLTYHSVCMIDKTLWNYPALKDWQNIMPIQTRSEITVYACKNT